MMTERWKPVVGYEGRYEVSDMGRVRSVDRRSSNGSRLKGRVLSAPPNHSGYPQVCLHIGQPRRPRTFLVHRLVLTAFVGPCPKGMEGCHFPDSDPTNNRLTNLRWDTPKSNCADKIVHGSLPDARGERNANAKLNATDIERIRDLRRNGCTLQVIADLMGVAGAHISGICLGKSWTSV